MFITLYDIALLLSTFVFGFAATGFAYLVMRNMKVVDVPNERSNHSVPTPRGGGIGIAFAVTCFLIVVDAPAALVWGFIALAVLSLWDDLKSLPARTRLLVHMLIAMLVIVGVYDGCVFNKAIPYAMEMVLLMLAWVWFINLFNFMDGSDGLAASQAMCICLGILALALTAAIPVHLISYALVVFAAVAGFIMWNWHPARIFMGDVGSIPLGYILGFMLVMLAGYRFWGAALILPAVFVADATITLLRRALKGERILQAHSSHAYQRAIRGGMPHDAVARNVIGVNILLIVLAVLSAQSANPLWQAGYVAVAYLIVFALLAWFASYRRKGHGLEPQVTEAEVVGEIPPPNHSLPPSGNETTA